MTIRYIIIFLFSLLLQACSSTNYYSIESYKKVNKELQKTYKLNKSYLVLSYDLARLDNTNCIFAKDFGLFANEQSHAQNYMQKFKLKHPHSTNLSKEAKIKIQKIANLLAKLQNKYQLLNKKNYHEVTVLANSNFNKVNPAEKLAKLDMITSHIPLMLPLYTPCLSSWYGIRKHPITKNYAMHCGIDLVSKKKAPIYASANGRVYFTGIQNGYGTVIEVDHGNNIKTKYAHLKRVFVKKGQKVIRGEAIGIQGNSGNAVGEHLHFEVHISGKHVNPYDFVGHGYECGIKK